MQELDYLTHGYILIKAYHVPSHRRMIHQKATQYRSKKDRYKVKKNRVSSRCTALSHNAHPTKALIPRKCESKDHPEGRVTDPCLPWLKVVYPFTSKCVFFFCFSFFWGGERWFWRKLYKCDPICRFLTRGLRNLHANSLDCSHRGLHTLYLQRLTQPLTLFTTSSTNEWCMPITTKDVRTKAAFEIFKVKLCLTM